MSADERSVQFASDNNAGIAPEALEALVQANAGHSAGYGNDRWTRAAAEALHACGEHEPSRRAMRSARERLLERAAKIPEGSYREGFLHRVPEHARTLSLARAWLDGAR